jgi:hypothetical protein
VEREYLIRESLEHFSRRCAGAAGHFLSFPQGICVLLASAHSTPAGEML